MFASSVATTRCQVFRGRLESRSASIASVGRVSTLVEIDSERGVIRLEDLLSELSRGRRRGSAEEFHRESSKTGEQLDELEQRRRWSEDVDRPAIRAGHGRQTDARDQCPPRRAHAYQTVLSRGWDPLREPGRRSIHGVRVTRCRDSTADRPTQARKPSSCALRPLEWRR